LFTNESIKAKIVLNNPEIILPRPAFARVVTNSFLGGDVQVALETSDRTIPKNIAKPISEKCDTKLIICQGDTITGKQLSSLSNITNRISQLLKETNQENLIENILNSIDQFDKTQENLDELIYLSKKEIEKFCWMAVHEHKHGVLPSEYDIREIDEDLYLELLQEFKSNIY